MSTWEPLPPQGINFVPMAIEAKQVAGFPGASLFRVENGSGPQTVTSLSPAQATVLLNLAQGTTQYVTTTAAGAALPSFATDPSTPVTGDIWYNSTNKVVKYYDGTAVQVVGSGGAVSGNSITSGTIAGSTSMNTTGSVTAASLSSTTDSTQNLQIYNTGNTHKVTVTVPSALAADYSLQLPSALPTASSQVLVSNTSGVTSWSPAMTIDGSNNVGIGTTTPNATLDTEKTDTDASTTFAQTAYLYRSLSPSANQTYNGTTFRDVVYGKGVVPSTNAKTVDTITAVDSLAQNDGSGNVYSLNGLAGGAYNTNSSTTINNVTGVKTWAESDLGTVTSINGAYFSTFNGGTATNMYGVYTNTINWGTATNRYGVFIATPQPGDIAAANDFGLYQQSSSAKNYFAGRVGIGTTSPGGILEVQGGATSASPIILKAGSIATATAAGNVTITAGDNTIGASSVSALAGNVAIAGGTGGSHAHGGNVTINGGFGNYNGDGAVTIVGATNGNNGGDVTIGSGGSTFGNAGTLALAGGHGNTGGSGAITLTGGSPSFGAGGAITLTAGTGAFNGPGGNIILQPGSGGTGAGNVGIGTATPGGNLAVDNGAHNATICLNGTCSTSLGGAIQSSTSNFNLNSNSDGSGSDGGFNFKANGSNILQVSNSGAITTYGNITGSSALAVAAGGTNQNLALSSSGIGVVNVSTGNGIGFSVLDPGVGAANYVTVKGAAAGGAPVIGTAGSDTNINLVLTPKGTGNVGIGTTSPNAPLEIDSGTAVNYTSTSNPTLGMLLVNTNSANPYNGSIIGFDPVGTANPYAWIGAVRNGTTSYSDLIFGARTGGATYGELMRITNSGNVGIGTTTPIAILDAQSAISASSGTDYGASFATTATNTGTSGYTGLRVNVNETSAGSGVNLLQDLQYNGSSKFSVGRYGSFSAGSNGIVWGTLGVGTPTPKSQFDVAGGVSIGSYGGVTAAPANGMIVSGNVGIGTTTPAGTLDVEGGTAAASTAGSSIYIVAQAAGAGAGNGGGGISLSTGAGAGGWSYGNISLNLGSGNAGNLQINKGWTSGYTSSSSGSGWPSTTVFANNSWSNDNNTTLIRLAASNGSSKSQNAFFGVVSTTGANYTPAFVFGQQTGATAYNESMRIDQNGNVGIGTTTPAGNLAVDNAGHTATLCLNGSCVSSLASGGGGTSTANQVFNSNSDGTGSDGGFNFQSNGSSLMTIANSGDTTFSSTTNSTSSTTGALVVSGGVGVAGALTTGGNITTARVLTTGGTATFPDYAFSHAAAGNGMGMFFAANNELGFSTTSLERMRISSAGNVGIGTTSPQATLDIPNFTSSTNTAQFGTFGIQSIGVNNGFLQDNGYWNGSSEIYRANGAVSMFQFGVPSPGDIAFRSAPNGLAGAVAPLTTNIVVKNNGNVGIGTTAPATALDVNGTINMQKSYFESVGALGALSCGANNITGFTTGLYELTACNSGTTTMNIPTITGFPTGSNSWNVTFYVTGGTASVFNVTYNSATTSVFWDANSTGGSGGSGYAGFTVPSGHTDVITCSLLNTSSVKVYCGVSAQY
jgi:hypothetical protein